MTSENDIIVADIGNSRIKLYDSETFASYKNNTDIDLNIYNYISNRRQRNVIFSSVNTFAKNKFLQVLTRLDCKAHDVAELLKTYSPIDFSGVTGMGNDRKLGLISALSVVNPPLITIDFGTCITVNIVNKNLQCLGGLIIPGLNTQARALEHYTSSLPRINIDFQFNKLGNNTVDAINSGIQNIVFKGLDAHIHSLSETLFRGETVNIVITGGIANIISNFNFSFRYHVKQNLVIEGIQKIAEKMEQIQKK